MKLWKTFFGRTIARNKNIQVHENLFFRWLTFDDDTLQTLIYKPNFTVNGLNYIQPLILASQSIPGNCCLLGLGGGGVAHALSGNSFIQEITAVEVYTPIIDYAQQYFAVKKIKNLKIIKNNAADFLNSNEQKFHHLIVDIALKELIPSECFNYKFYSDCKKSLHEDGVLAINIAATRQQTIVIAWIKQLFETQGTIIIPVKGCANIIVLAGNKKAINTILENKPANYRALWDIQMGYHLTY